MKYDVEKDLWWNKKGLVLKRITEILDHIFKDTLGENKEVFNAELLIRQNMIETEKIMKSLFGHPYPYYLDEDGTYSRIKFLEDEVIEKVMKRYRNR